MNVILLEKVRNLGNIGDQVSVKAGFGRNYLIPQGKAVAATASNVAEFEQRRTELEAKAAEQKTAAEKQAASLSELTVSVARKASDEGKLFGSVGPRDIAIAIVEAGVEVKKQQVTMPEGPIRNIGEYSVTLHLHTDVSADVTVNVVALQA